MRRTKKQPEPNYLDLVPKRNPALGYHLDENQIVVLEQENKGFFNRIAQKIFHRPRISYIHLDVFGSFVWSLIDGSSTVEEIAGQVKEHFGEEAEPLYPRIVQYFHTLEGYEFVEIPKKAGESGKK